MLIEKPYKLVVLDDSATMRGALESIVSTNPAFQFFGFEDPEKALAFIEKEKVRIVLVDINMPGMFGDDVLRRCMAMKLGIQVYVVTGSDSITIADRCMNVGARGIIPKPLIKTACRKALADTEVFFEQWNGNLHYFLNQKKEA